MSEEKKGFLGGQSFLTLLACLFIFLAVSGNGAVTPALNAMKQGLWQDIPASTITLISNLPSLFAILGCLLTGWIGGKYMTWKAWSILTLLVYTIAGVLPAVLSMTDFYQTLACRAVFGLGMGMMWPLGNSLIMVLYEGRAQENVLGWGQSVQSFGGVVMQIIGGYLATIQPQYCYYAYLIAILGILFAFGLPNIPKTTEVAEKKEKVPMPPVVWAFIVLLFVFMLVVIPILVGNSTIMHERNFGDSFWSGIVTSAYTMGGVVAGIVFGFEWKAIGRYSVAVGFFVMAIGFAICYWSTSTMMMFFALFISGLGAVTCRPAIYKVLGDLVTPEQVAQVLGMGTAVFNLGTFCSTYYIKFVNATFYGGVEKADQPIFVSMIILAVVGVIFVFVAQAMNKKDAAAE